MFPFIQSSLKARQSRKVTIRKETGEITIQTLSSPTVRRKKHKALDTANNPVDTYGSQILTELKLCSNSLGADSGYAPVDEDDNDDRVSTDGTLRRLKRCAGEGNDDLAESSKHMDIRILKEKVRGRKK